MKQLIFISTILLAISCTSKQEENKQESMNESLNQEQAVIVHFNYDIQGLDSLYQLEDKLGKIIPFRIIN